MHPSYGVLQQKENHPVFGLACSGAAAPVSATGAPAAYDVKVEGKVYHVEVAASGELSSVTPSQPSTAAPQPASASSSESAQSINAPLAGNVFKILVRAGDVVNEGDVVIILEAMKMETEIRSAISGTVSEVLVGEGDAVASAQPLIALG